MPDSILEPDEIGAEYDLSESRPNPYAARYVEGTNLVPLDPDVRKVFPDARAVNEALRALAKIIEQHSPAA